MAGLRAPRIPVFLERESLPAWVRHPATRIAGLAVAALAVTGQAAGLVGDGAFIVAAVGGVPQVLIWAQAAARHATLILGNSREGA